MLHLQPNISNLKKIMEIWTELSKSQIFDGIIPLDIRALNFCFKSRLKIVAKNEIIISEGDSAEYCIFVLKGKLKSVNYDSDGKENIYNKYESGEVFGLNEAYTSSKSYLHTLIACEKSSIILFNRYRFLQPCENQCYRHKKLINNLTKVAINQNMELSLRINILSKKTTREKVLAYLNHISKSTSSKYFDIPLNRKELASYLCVDRSALSIELGKMKKEKLIDFDKNHFKILID